ncbi:hypothetical protein [Roseibacillus persicicus]|uniref:hypothetical protein n=1 Tax=Roseibacillus persicicus TaxID=454148 RepID=UPI00280FF9AC|nr:hypothetical protein [Roseibacillus persicicus]MDQ8190121.1 hypothetical protein [Roseibacillus persicicus]
MTLPSFFSFSATSFLLVSSLTAVEDVPQSLDFAKSNEDSLYNGVGLEFLADSQFFTASFEPFDASLGTLVSITVRCEINGLFDGAVADGSDFAAAYGSLGGSFAMGGLTFDGTGGNQGVEAESGETLTGNFGISPYQRTLQVADAGVTYHPGLIDLFLGEEAFDFTYNSPVMIDFDSVQDLQASFNATLSITYSYEPAEPGSSPLSIVQLVRNSAEGEVMIEWNSSPDESYRVLAAERPEPNLFEVVATSVSGESGQTTRFTESVPATVAKRFYRVETVTE